MKRAIFTLFILFLFVLNGFAQVPQKINYQAIIRDASGQPIVNQMVSLRLSILNGPTGAALYTDMLNIQTNAYGLVNLQIGANTYLGNFADISWEGSPTNPARYLRVEVDLNGTNAFTSVGDPVELVSVPYALVSQDNQWKVNLANGNVTNKNTGNIGIGGTPSNNAILDIQSTSKGILIPRVPAANAITGTEGLLVYQTGTPVGFRYFKGGQWVGLQDDTGGSSGSTGSGSIVPFSSGNSYVTLTTNIGAQIVSAIGTGASAGVILSNGTIPVNTNGLTPIIIPRDGTIKSIYATFMNNLAQAIIGSNVTIYAQVYKSLNDSDPYQAIPGTLVTLSPGYTGSVNLGQLSTGSSSSSESVTAGTRLIVVYSAAVTAGLANSITIAGNASASLNIQ